MPELVASLCTLLVLAPLALMPGLGEFLYRPMAAGGGLRDDLGLPALAVVRPVPVGAAGSGRTPTTAMTHEPATMTDDAR